MITGAGSGIGRALAVELSLRGAHLLLVGRRESALQETMAALHSPQSTTIIVGDITDPAGRDQIVSEVKRLGRLDLLINNAGVVISGPLVADDAEARRLMVDTNLIAPMELTLALLPMLKTGAPSRIVNVGSMFGDIAFPYFSAYSATKFGLRGWSDGLRRELAPMGIGVTYAAPRGTRTPAAESFASLAEAFDMRLDPPEKVAIQITDAIANDANTAYPMGMERVFVLMQRLFPSIIDHALGKQLAKAKSALRLSAILVGLAATTTQAADLTVEVSGIRDATGAVRIALYSEPSTFRHEKDSMHVLSLPATQGTISGLFHDIPEGRYAVIAYHDENQNQKMDLFLGMFPAEGWGLSNNSTPFGPPQFEDSAFDVSEPITAITIPLHY